MARYLALDWDRNSFHILTAEVSKQGIEIGATAEWRPDEELSPRTAESLGKKLREFLKSSGIAAGPVLACVGRDRVVLKEITYPAVSANEEPALVRFQATKDLADAADDVVLDYASLPGAASSSERRALAVIVRRELQSSIQHMCRVAGLKLLALVPRPFVMAGCLERAHIPQVHSGKESAAVVLVGERSAELSILQGSTLVFSRSLNNLSQLSTEVRRGLTVFANQPGATAQRAPRALFLVGGNGAAGNLQDALGLPVENLDVLTASERTRVNGARQGSLAACLGLLQAWSAKQVPINLASPKEPVAVVDQGKRRKLFLWAGAAAGLLIAFVCGQILLASQKSQIKSLGEEKEEIEAKFNRFKQDRADLEGLKDWEKGAIPWIDEFYDLAARFPQETGFKITKVEIIPLRNKDKFQARMTLTGVAPPGKEQLVHTFIQSMRDPHLVARVERYQTDAGSYKIQVDISRQGARDYQTRLVLPYGAGGPPPAKKETAKKKDPPKKSDSRPKPGPGDKKKSPTISLPLDGLNIPLDGLNIPLDGLIPDGDNKGTPAIIRLPLGGEP